MKSVMHTEIGVRQQMYLFKKHINKQSMEKVIKKKILKYWPWFISFSSSSIGLICVLGQYSRSACSRSPPRFTVNTQWGRTSITQKTMGNTIMSIWSTAENSPWVWAGLFPKQTIYGPWNLLVTIWELHVTIFQEKLILESLLLDHSCA